MLAQTFGVDTLGQFIITVGHFSAEARITVE